MESPKDFPKAACREGPTSDVLGPASGWSGLIDCIQILHLKEVAAKAIPKSQASDPITCGIGLEAQSFLGFPPGQQVPLGARSGKVSHPISEEGALPGDFSQQSCSLLL